MTSSEIPDDMRPRSDSLPDQSASVGAKRKSILKKEALNREEMEGLLSGSGAVGAASSRNSFATPLDGTPARAATAADEKTVDEDVTPPIVRHLPRLSDSTDLQRRVHPPCVAQLPTSQSIATIAEFDTDCDEESSVEGELDRDAGRPRTDSAPSEDRRKPREFQHSVVGASARDDAAPLDNIRSPQNANVPLPQSTDINLNPPPSSRVAPPIPVRLQAPSGADKLGNHLPHLSVPLDQPETTAFTHNLFPTLDFIDEFAD